MRAHPDLTEKWVQKLISEDPSIIGLGDLVLRAQERSQPHAGRLDLLLQDPETKRRYEVELQLGATDEAHIIRTIEYWDIERKRYPQYEHCAVLVAEDITSRFLNVIALFNGMVPFIAIQMRAMTVGQHLTLTFTKVMDELSRGFVDEDEDADAAPTDRAYWEKKASKVSVSLADELLAILKEFDASLELKYNKFYIGLGRSGLAYNFVSFRPKKSHVNLEIKLPESDDLDSKIEAADIEALEYNSRYGQYRLSLTPADVKEKSAVLRELMQLAFERRATLS
jgi:predicted transport protein